MNIALKILKIIGGIAAGLALGFVGLFVFIFIGMPFEEVDISGWLAAVVNFMPLVVAIFLFSFTTNAIIQAKEKLVASILGVVVVALVLVDSVFGFMGKPNYWIFAIKGPLAFGLTFGAGYLSLKIRTSEKKKRGFLIAFGIIALVLLGGPIAAVIIVRSMGITM